MKEPEGDNGIECLIRLSINKKFKLRPLLPENHSLVWLNLGSGGEDGIIKSISKKRSDPEAQKKNPTVHYLPLPYLSHIIQPLNAAQVCAILTANAHAAKKTLKLPKIATNQKV